MPSHAARRVKTHTGAHPADKYTHFTHGRKGHLQPHPSQKRYGQPPIFFTQLQQYTSGGPKSGVRPLPHDVGGVDTPLAKHTKTHHLCVCPSISFFLYGPPHIFFSQPPSPHPHHHTGTFQRGPTCRWDTLRPNSFWPGTREETQVLFESFRAHGLAAELRPDILSGSDLDFRHFRMFSVFEGVHSKYSADKRSTHASF